MGIQARFRYGAALVAAALFAQSADAQEGTITLPPIDVGYTRLGGSIVGASTSIITAKDIESSPAQNLPDILGRQAGIQLQHLYGTPNGAGSTVDLRGFGVFAQSNTLILVNGRRYQDFDLQGFDFASIPLNSIERVEITRGNSGTVLYGDGAIGGVINIVTKQGASLTQKGGVEALGGSYSYREGRVSAGGTDGPWSAALFGNSGAYNGYRHNSDSWQYNGAANFAYRAPLWSAYLNLAGDSQRQSLPGALRNQPTASIGYTLATPQETNTPFDWAKKQGLNLTAGGTATLRPGVELIVDGGIRYKHQESLFYSYVDPTTFVFSPAAASPSSYILTDMTTASFTPRIDAMHRLFGVNNRLLTGIDIYNTVYGSDRRITPAGLVLHRYDIRQTTGAFYAMNTTSVRPDTDVSIGGRLQRNIIKGADAYNPAADVFSNTCCYSPGLPIEAPPFSGSEWQYAAHAGIEHQINPALTIFARLARAFRLPNADERVGAGSANTAIAPTFDLKTQTSHDVEGGAKVRLGPVRIESTAYVMDIKNEIHYIPAIGTNVNLDPTRRVGWENAVLVAATDSLRLHGSATYTHATFREGQFAGNRVPLVSDWTGSAGFSWDVWRKFVVLDVTTRMWSSRVMDNDQANTQPRIPANATVDVKLGGQYDRFFWSVAVLNVLGMHYYDYAIASGGFPATTIFPVTPGTPGIYNAYPLPGRTFMVRAGATF